MSREQPPQAGLAPSSRLGVVVEEHGAHGMRG